MKLEIKASAPYSLYSVIQSHGWSDLPPFNVLSKNSIAVGVSVGNRAIDCRVDAIKNGLVLEAKQINTNVSKAIRHMFRLEDTMQPFYAYAKSVGRTWIKKNQMGRMLRSQTIFEDLVKMVLTTNCSWSFTKIMVERLVTTLGQKTPLGASLFPTPEALAKKRERFYRDKIRAGYRSPHLQKIGKLFSKNLIDTASWMDPMRDTQDIRKEILSVPGAGAYVADNMLKLMGRFEYLGIDSWVRKKLSMTDSEIKETYAPHGPYQGLILWCDVTRDWL
ncbi:MAG: hypothetical protein KDD48_00645 [Bdellovibrionales bacterium]|nr:hypothetical protein [Bdellovibrionales bacterium]